jgi:hypothetical protein
MAKFRLKYTSPFKAVLTLLAIAFSKPVGHQVISEQQTTNFGTSHACHLKFAVFHGQSMGVCECDTRSICKNLLSLS